MGHHQAGRLTEAERAYRGALQRSPQHRKALEMLGIVLSQQGRHADAVEPLRAAAASAPHDAVLRHNLAKVLRAAGKTREAIDAYRTAAALQPQLLPAHLGLASALRAAGRPDDAAAAYRDLLEIAPGHAEARLQLGDALEAAGDDAGAAEAYRGLLANNPEYVPANLALGALLRRRGDHSAALACYRRVLQRRPEHNSAHCACGDLLLDAGDDNAATRHYRAALENDAQQAGVLNNLGIALKRLGRAGDATESCRRAVALEPGNAAFRVNLGSALLAAGALDEARAAYLESLRLDPQLATAHHDAGEVCRAMGRTDEARQHFESALRLAPLPDTRLALATLLPPVYESLEDLRAWRTRFEQGVDALVADELRIDPATVRVATSFYLAYQGLNDRRIMEQLAKLFVPQQPIGDRSRNSRALSTRSSVLSSAERSMRQQAAPGDRRLRIGFLSAYLRDHTLGRLLRGLIAQLDRRRFHVTALSLGEHRDPIADFIRSHSDEYLELPHLAAAARDDIAALHLDALVFSGVLMDPQTYALACQRFAPVQCVTWGHPVTTGIPTMDYYLSSRLFEPEQGAEDHYSEQLVQLDGLNTYYYRPSISDQQLRREDFGLRDDANIYLCAQTLFKLHPDFDAMLRGILDADPRGEVVLLDSGRPEWRELLERRFAGTLGGAADRIRFLRGQDHARFLSLLTLADVILDTPHFCGGNTTLEAIAVGTPVVTLPSGFRRGRFTLGYYRKLGITDAVAADENDYVQIALRIGRDRKYRDTLRLRILAASGRVFEDEESVSELEAFLETAVGRARANA